MDRAGLSANDGPTHHGLFDISYLRCVPHAVVMQPKDEDELVDMLHTAITHQGPAFIRYPRGAGTGVKIKAQPARLPIGLAEVLRANPDVPYEKRIEVARFMEDLTASYQAGWYSVISLHGGGSPAAMKQEIWRNYPVGDKVALVERLLDRGLVDDPARPITRTRQPGRCCDSGCTQPGQALMVPLPGPGRQAAEWAPTLNTKQQGIPGAAR